MRNATAAARERWMHPLVPGNKVFCRDDEERYESAANGGYMKLFSLK